MTAPASTMTPELVVEALRLRVAGLGRTEAARRLGVSPSVLRAWSSRYQIGFRDSRKRPQPRGSEGPPRLRRIIEATAAAGGVSVASILGAGRPHRTVVVRQAAMLACRQLAGASLPQIGKAMGRDHTTVLHGIQAAQGRPETAELVRRVKCAIARPDLSSLPAVVESSLVQAAGQAGGGACDAARQQSRGAA